MNVSVFLSLAFVDILTLVSAIANFYNFVCRSLVPVLTKTVKIGTPRQAKHALRCIATLCKNKDNIFESIFEVLRDVFFDFVHSLYRNL